MSNKIRILKNAMLGIALMLCLPSLAVEYHFKRYGMFDGLPTQRVNCCMQDSRGFMWFGTSIGLACFDGMTFRTNIPVSGDASVLRDVSVTGLVEDSSGRLWMGTSSGLFCYDIARDMLLSPEGQDWPVEEIVGIWLDGDENLWIRTNWFFHRINIRTNAHKAYAPDEYFQPTDFVVTSSGVLWVLSVDGHIHRYNAQNDSFTAYPIVPDSLDARMKILAKGVEREDGMIMIMTCLSGARLFSPTTKKVETLFTRYDGEPPVFTHTMMKRDEHEYWLATEEGIYIWRNDENEPSMTHLTMNASDVNSLCDNAIHALYQDKEGGVWVGTAFGGISYMSSDQSSFRHIRLLNAQGLVQSRVARSIISSADGTLWIGAEDGGLYSYDTNTETITAHDQLNWQGQPLPVNVQSLLMVDGQLWIGSFDGSIYIYDIAADKITGRMPLPFSFPVDMMLTEDGRVYVANTIALLEMQPTHDGYTFHKVEGLPGGFTHYLYKDQRGDIWTAMIGQGVWRLKDSHAERGKAEWEKMDFGNDFMCTIFEDSRGTIWVGSQTNGLFYYDADSHKGVPLQNTLHQDGLGVYRIIEDNRGVLWISTSNGLYSYNLQSGNVIRYGLSSILNSPQFNFNSGYVDNAGRIYFGALDGILSFTPEMVDQPETDLTVYFTDYINEGTSFGVCFSVPVYSIQETLWFRYRLKGVDKDWTVVQGQRNIRYSNLEYGKYELEVESSLQNGNWTGNISCLTIDIVAPWYATTLAKWLYALCIVIAGLILYKRYMHRRQEKKQSEMERLRIEREKELSQEKMKFFTAITHEIRTPLTLIMTPVKSLIDNFSAQKAQRMLPTIHRNASDLLNLVNQILDYRKLEQGRAKLELSHGDFNEFCKTVMDLFTEMAEKKHIDFTTNIDGPLYMNFDKEKMQRIVINLLSNAFKFTPENGRIRLETHVVGRQCELTVSDNGVGISKEDIPHVFELFYQSEASKDPGLENQVSVGSGIGLHLVREFVNMHSGQVTVESQHETTDGASGTTFTVTLPIDLSAPVSHSDDVDESVTEAEDLTEDKIADDGDEAAIQLENRKPTILLVDDNEELRQYLYLELCDEYEILQAANGQEGLDLALEREVDIVVSDVMMPVMDGMELCRQLKDNVKTSHLFVILLTAKVGEQYRLTGYKSGADYYIAKPFNIEILRDRIAYLYKLRQQRHDMFLHDIDITPKELTNSPLDEEFYNKAVQFVNQNMSNEEYGVEQFSSDMCMSRMTLYRKIQNITGQKPLEFIRTIRLKRAATLLKTTDHSILEIAEMVGFGTPRNFSKNFKMMYGQSPSEYKKQS